MAKETEETKAQETPVDLQKLEKDVKFLTKHLNRLQDLVHSLDADMEKIKGKYSNV